MRCDSTLSITTGQAFLPQVSKHFSSVIYFGNAPDGVTRSIFTVNFGSWTSLPDCE